MHADQRGPEESAGPLQKQPSGISFEFLSRRAHLTTFQPEVSRIGVGSAVRVSRHPMDLQRVSCGAAWRASRSCGSALRAQRV